MIKKMCSLFIASAMLLTTVSGVFAATNVPAESGATIEQAVGNIITNGSFEYSDSITPVELNSEGEGWLIPQKGVSGASYQVTSDAAYGNSINSMYVQNTVNSAGDGTQYQKHGSFGYKFKARLNQWYKFSYKVRNASEAGRARMVLLYSELTDGALVKENGMYVADPDGIYSTENKAIDTPKADLGWYTVEGYFQLTDSNKCTDESDESYWYRDVAVYSRMLWGSGGCKIYVDDVTLTPVEGTFNSDFSMQLYSGASSSFTYGWGTPGAVTDVVNAPTNDSSFPTGGKMININASKSNYQKVALDSDKTYLLSAWVMVPTTGSPMTRISFYDDNASITSTTYGDNKTTVGSGNLAAMNNAGIYIPNDGQWYHVMSTIYDGFAETYGRSHYDTQIYITAANSPTGSAGSGTFTDSDVYVAEYSIKPMDNNLVKYPGMIGYGRQAAGNRTAVDKSSEFRYNNATKTAVNKQTVTVSGGDDSTETDDVKFENVINAPDMSYVKVTQSDNTKSAAINAGQYRYKKGYRYTYSADLRIDSSMAADSTVARFTHWGDLANSTMNVTKDWQHFEYVLDVLGNVGSDSTLGIKVYSNETEKNILHVRNFTITETPINAAQAEVTAAIAFNDTETEIVPTVTPAENKCSAAAYRYKYYSQDTASGDKTLVLAGQTVIGGTVPNLTGVDASKYYTLEVTPMSDYGVWGSTVTTAVLTNSVFTFGDIVVYNAEDGSPISSIAGVNKVGAYVKIENPEITPKDFALVAAAYAGDTFVGASLKQQTVAAEDGATIELDDDLTLTGDVTSVKVFLWDSFTSLKPYQEATELTRASSALANTKAKLADNGNITIAFLGGSITAGTGASSADTRYANLVKDWFESKTDGTVTYKNYGIGGTGSDYGAARIGAKLSSDNPDVLFVEFAVNDENKTEKTLTPYMESIVRQAKNNNPYIDIIFINSFMGNFIDEYDAGQLPVSVTLNNEIADFYDIASINVGQYTYNAIRDLNGGNALGSIAESSDAYYTYMKDNSHPVDAGHKLYADKINAYLEALYNADAVAKPAMTSKALSDYILGTYSTIENAVSASSVQLNGWDNLKNDEDENVKAPSYGWPIYYSDAEGESLTITFNGTGLLLWMPRHNTTGVMSIKVDDSDAYDFDTWAPDTDYKIQQTWLTDYATKLIPVASGLDSGKHTVVITNKGVASEYNTSGATTKTNAYITGYMVKTN